MATIDGTAGNDFIHRAGDGLVPPPGFTEVIGVSDGADTIEPGLGSDIVFAGGGDDQIFVNDAAAISGLPEHLDGGDGEDFVVFRTAGSVDLSSCVFSSIEGLALSNSAGLLEIKVTPQQLSSLTAVSAGGLGATRVVLSEPGEVMFSASAASIVNLDVLAGSEGNDVFDVVATASRLTISGEGGDDVVFFGYDRPFFGFPPFITLLGGDGDDVLSGDRAKFLMDGGKGKDELNGGKLADTLDGGAGRDRLTGGRGRDELYGGDGTDRFLFRRLDDSPAPAADRLNDFDLGEGDLIVLRRLDADTTLAGDQAFTLAGDAFTGVAGELIQTVLGPNRTLIQADVDGDGTADFALEVTSAVGVLGAEAFVL